MPYFSYNSKARLATCDQRLQDLFNEIIKEYDCAILCGHRTKEEQEKAFDAGNSKLHFPRSRHNKSPSIAVDVVPYLTKEPHIIWGGFDEYNKYFKDRFKTLKDYNNFVTCTYTVFANHVIDKATEMGIPLEWGGSWKTIVDMPHYQLII